MAVGATLTRNKSSHTAKKNLGIEFNAESETGGSRCNPSDPWTHVCVDALHVITTSLRKVQIHSLSGSVQFIT